MRIIATPIPGVSVVEITQVRDGRGSLYRAFCDDELRKVFKHRTIRQVNVSHTAMVGTIRGLHYQMHPFEEMKFVRCLRGRVWDVALDLRPSSKTFRQWHAEELSPDNALMMIIPEGCAHGFQVLDEGSELLYLHTAPYEPQSEAGVRFDDPVIGIAWPLPVTDISERDKSHSLFRW